MIYLTGILQWIWNKISVAGLQTIDQRLVISVKNSTSGDPQQLAWALQNNSYFSQQVPVILSQIWISEGKPRETFTQDCKQLRDGLVYKRDLMKGNNLRYFASVDPPSTSFNIHIRATVKLIGRILVILHWIQQDCCRHLASFLDTMLYHPMLDLFSQAFSVVK